MVEATIFHALEQKKNTKILIKDMPKIHLQHFINPNCSYGLYEVEVD